MPIDCYPPRRAKHPTFSSKPFAPISALLHHNPEAKLPVLPAEHNTTCTAFSMKGMEGLNTLQKHSHTHSWDRYRLCTSEKAGPRTHYALNHLKITCMFFLIKLQLFKNIFHLYPLMTHSEWLQQQQLLSPTLFEKQNPNKKAHPNTPKTQHQAIHPAELRRGSVKSQTCCIPEFCMHFSDIQISPLIDLQLCNVCITCHHGYWSRFHMLQTEDL